MVGLLPSHNCTPQHYLSILHSDVTTPKPTLFCYVRHVSVRAHTQVFSSQTECEQLVGLVIVASAHSPAPHQQRITSLYVNSHESKFLGIPWDEKPPRCANTLTSPGAVWGRWRASFHFFLGRTPSPHPAMPSQTQSSAHHLRT